MGEAREGMAVLVGPGRRMEELGAVLRALASVHLQGGAPATEALDDLEGLVATRSGAGRILLELDEIPTEDIGYLRRFLERHSQWRLLLLGADEGGPKAKRLLSFKGSRWLPWPPDLDQLRGILVEGRGREPEAPPAAAGDPLEGEIGDERVPRPPGDRRAAPDGALDLGSLLEEVLAGRAVGGEEAPRYLYRSEVELPVVVDRALLVEAIEGLLALAEACCGTAQVIGVRTAIAEAAAGASAEVVIDFPPGPLTDGDLPGLLDGGFRGASPLEQGVAAARQAVASLAEVGGRVELGPGRPGRLSLLLSLPLAEGVQGAVDA